MLKVCEGLSYVKVHEKLRKYVELDTSRAKVGAVASDRTTKFFLMMQK